MKTKFGILYVHHSILNPRAELEQEIEERRKRTPATVCENKRR